MTASESSTSTERQGFSSVFWIANWMELVERFAYYGVRVILPVFMVEAIALGGPEFDHVQKGTVYAIWALVQSFVPIFTGGFADRYGYKLNIAISTVLKIIGYFGMGYCVRFAEFLDGAPLSETRAAGSDSAYWIFFLGAMFLATGTAIFKPGLQGLIANQMPKSKASFGWALFYQCVNIGGFLGPMAAGYLRILDWEYAFLLCAAAISLNFIPLFLFREPDHGGDDHDFHPGQVLWAAIKGLLEPRLFFFTVCFAGFWLMFYQLFDILPNFIDDWIDSRAAASAVEGVDVVLCLLGITAFIALGRAMILRAEGKAMNAKAKGTYGILLCLLLLIEIITRLMGSPAGLSVPTINGGNLTQEWMINANALLISISAFIIGWLTGKTRSLMAIVIGIGISAVAIYALGMSMNGWWTLGAIALFSLGEMSASPTKMRYLASIAPPGKEGLYMGYVNFTVGIGWSIGSIIAGNMYQEGGDKVELARRHMIQEQGMDATMVEGIERSEVMNVFQEGLSIDGFEARKVLWDIYEPQSMWLIFTLIGVASMIGVVIYDRVTRAASANKGHVFNTHGGHLVTAALAPIAAAFWWYFYELTANQGKGLDEALAVIVQAVMFSGMFLISLFSPYRPEDTGAEPTRTPE
jgi:dipeptide/tripeptide permease